MYNIKVPPDIALLDPLTDEPTKDPPMSFKKFVLGTLLNDSRWRRDLESIETALAIREKVRVLGNSGDVLLLEDAHLKALKEVAEKPTDGNYGNWSSLGLTQLFPFLAAIRDAEKAKIDNKADKPKKTDNDKA